MISRNRRTISSAGVSLADTPQYPGFPVRAVVIRCLSIRGFHLGDFTCQCRAPVDQVLDLFIQRIDAVTQGVEFIVSAHVLIPP
jgi:hypothetical protein